MPRDPVTVLLAISAATLLAVLAVELRSEPVAPTQAHAARQDGGSDEPPSLSNTPELSLPPLDSFTETVERPLFNASRRQQEADDEGDTDARASVPDESDEEVRLVLLAVFIRGEDRMALVRNPEAGNVVTVRAGDSIEDWSLAEIQPDAVVLERRDSRATLALRQFGPDPGSARNGD